MFVEMLLTLLDHIQTPFLYQNIYIFIKKSALTTFSTIRPLINLSLEVGHQRGGAKAKCVGAEPIGLLVKLGQIFSLNKIYSFPFNVVQPEL